VLTGAQMSAIYRAIEDIRFFDYPAVFVGIRLDGAGDHDDFSFKHLPL